MSAMQLMVGISHVDGPVQTDLAEHTWAHQPRSSERHGAAPVALQPIVGLFGLMALAAVVATALEILPI